MRRKIIGMLICTLLIVTAISAVGQIKNISIIKDDNEINPTNNGDKWMKTYDFSIYDYGESVIQTSDGGYIVAGSTTPFVIGNYDIFILKTDNMGNNIWSGKFGGENWEKAVTIKDTSDGGYLIIGYTETYATGDYDIWLIKTDSDGNMVWDKTFGNSEYNETGLDVIEISDGFMILGVKQLFDDWMNPNSIWLIKTDSNGNLEWDKTISKEDKGCSGRIIQKLDNGGYIIAGSIRYSGGPSTSDIYLLKVDDEGTIVWEKTFNRNKYEYCYSFDKSSDDGFIILANTYEPDPLWYDIWLIKTNSEGELLWDKTYARNGYDWGNSVQTTTDGGYIIAGYMNKVHGTDGFLLKTNNLGDKEWYKTYCKTRFNLINEVQQTKDGGYILTGYTDEVPLPLRTDVWLIKTDSDGETTTSRTRNLIRNWLLEWFPNLFRFFQIFNLGR